MGTCECIVDKEVVCHSHDEVCVRRRNDEGADHTHTVIGVVCGTPIDAAVPVSILPLIPRLSEMFKSELQCHNNLGVNDLLTRKCPNQNIFPLCVKLYGVI